MSAPPLSFSNPPPTMPAIQVQKNRRKRTTPVVRRDRDHVLQRTLDTLGLESLNHTSRMSTKMADHAVGMGAPDEAVAWGKKKISIPDLPLEVQRAIFKHAASTELIALSLVSKHFRDLAAEVLYRSYHIVFLDDDDINNDSPIDGLAVGLDTFVTSDYDYAKHLKEIILETFSSGDKAALAYRLYQYHESCGKFMNTLFLLTLQKAKALETFKWDIRVELSRRVFRALHQIEALQHLHLRMQAGSSIYQTPPALGVSPPPPLPNGLFPPPPGPPAIHANSQVLLPPGFNTTVAYSSTHTNSYTAGNKAAQKAHQKHLNSILPKIKSPPTLSGFKNLKTLSVLDMDSHDYVDELKTCIRNSFPTLNTLKLSLSESLAIKSRKPPPEIHSDTDSEVEDEFGQPIPPPPTAGASDPNGPSKAFKAQEEKKRQEGMLAKILGWEPPAPKPKLKAPLKVEPEKAEKEKTKVKEDPKRRFIRDLAPIAKRLMSSVKPDTDIAGEGKETLAMIERASRTYLESVEKEKVLNAPSAESSTPKGTPVSSTASLDGHEGATTANGVLIDETPGLFDNPTKKKKPASTEIGFANPDDIDVDEPEEHDHEFEASNAEPSDAETASLETPSLESTETDGFLVDQSNAAEQTTEGEQEIHGVEKAAGGLKALLSLCHKENLLMYRQIVCDFAVQLKKDGVALSSVGDSIAADGTLSAKDRKDILVAIRAALEGSNQGETDIKFLPPSTGNSDAGVGENASNTNTKHSDTGMSEYIRNTRGLTLSTLAIYLIPVRAHVLTQTVDVHVLQTITLLNVGPQTHFWNTMASKNDDSPLPLHKITTDNVTLPFLSFVSKLEKVTELVMLERHSKIKVESAASKTTVTIEQIRKLALKKHVSKLRILVIRNDQMKGNPPTSDWDLNIKTTMLLCQRANNLEELACILSNKAVHTFLQFVGGLVSLRALHLIQSRDPDNCAYALNEFRKFLADSMSHNRHLKIDYIAFQDSVEMFVRRKPVVKTSSGPKPNDKGKSVEKTAKILADIVLNGVPNWEGAMAQSGSTDDDSSDDEDDEDVNYSKGLKVEMIGGMRLVDIQSVRIFEKDILTGTL